MASFYPYRYVQTFHERVGHLQEKRLYSFTSTKSNLCYWVWVERYDCDVFAIKFHLKAHRLSPHKYQVETRTFEPRTIVLTCIQIMLEVFRENGNASFGFIGAASESESENLTKRFRFYRRMMATYFSDRHFVHIELPEKSTYLMVNRHGLASNPDYISRIQEAFAEQYPYFE